MVATSVLENRVQSLSLWSTTNTADSNCRVNPQPALQNFGDSPTSLDFLHRPTISKSLGQRAVPYRTTHVFFIPTSVLSGLNRII